MVILIKNLDYVACAKYDYLRAFPKNLKHFNIEEYMEV